jgi:hypothetical protein
MCDSGLPRRASRSGVPAISWGGMRGTGHDTGSACRGQSARLDRCVTGGAVM